MRRFFACVLAFVVLILPAVGADTVSPALWRIQTPGGSIVMMGTVHVLPPNLDWMSADVRKAIEAADTFVFEIPTDEATGAAAMQSIAERGRLPPGKTLHQLLSRRAQHDLDTVLASLSIPTGKLDGVRPWLATLIIEQTLITRLGQTSPGPDFTLAAIAKKKGKPTRYLESVAQQMALLAPQDPKLELEYFESSLKNFDDSKAELERLTKAWGQGNVAEISAITDEEFADIPKTRAYFLDNRTKAWSQKIARMTHERQNIFIAVGIAHMVGKNGLPALLRAKGFKVEGP